MMGAPDADDDVDEDIDVSEDDDAKDDSGAGSVTVRGRCARQIERVVS
jgi:hypothetical protein